MVDRAGLMLPESRAAAMELGPQNAFSVARRDPSRSSGLSGLGPTMADVQVGFEQIVSQPAPDYTAMRAPRESSGPSVFFDQARNLFSVNGYAFDAEDYAAAVQSRQFLDQPAGGPPDAGSWTRLSPSMYEQYMSQIEDPTLGTRFGRSFDIGVQNLKTLGGAGLQFLGAEETGAGVVNRASEELQRLSPFQVSAAEVASGELGAIEYAVSVIGQQGPNILESIGAALVGAAAGGVASGNPVGAAVGSFGALLSKGVIKGAAREAAEAYARGAASAEQKKLLARIGGAAAATAVNNYAIGVSDVYSEIREQGAGPENVDARAVSAALGIPYAVLSTIPEAIAAGRLFGFSNATGGLLRRVGTGAAVGAGLEGVTEAGQEALVMAGGQQFGGDYTDEYLSRLVEAGVAGAVVGGSIGGVVNIRAGKPADVLQGRQEPPADADADPAAAPLGLPAPALGLPAPALGLPAPAAAPDQLGLPAPAVAGLLPPPALVTPAPTQPIAPPPPGARPLQPMPEDLSGPVAEGFQRAADAGPGYRPPVPPAQPAAPDFTVGAEPVQPIATQRTDLPPGMQRLRQRPSERVETYAPTPAPAGETAIAAQLNRLLQQQQVQQEAAAAAAQAQQEARETQATEDTQRLVAGAERWDEFSAEVIGAPTLESLPQRVQDAWVEAVAQGQSPRGMPLQQYYTALVAAADRRAPGDQQLRRQATEEPPIVTPAPEAAPKASRAKSPLEKRTLATGVYGTATGKSFKTANGAEMQRPSVAKLLGVKPAELRVIGAGKGFALTPTPPKPKRGKPDDVRERGAKESDLRKGPKAGREARSRDTKGQTPTGKSAQKTTQKDTTQGQPPVRETEVVVNRGDSAPVDMSVTAAWENYVKPFLMVPVDRTIISKGEPATAWASAVKAGRGNVDSAIEILRASVSYSALEAQMILQQDPEVSIVSEDARDMALYSLLETAFLGDTTGSKPAVLGNRSAVRFAQDTLLEHTFTQADREALLDFATDTDITAARTAAKPNQQMQALNALLESTGVISTVENVDADTKSNPASNLAEEIVEYNQAPHTPEGWEQRRLRDMVRDFVTYARDNPEAYGSLVEGNTPLYQYLDKGTVRIRQGQITPDPGAIDPRTQERVSAEPDVVERGGVGLGQLRARTPGVETRGRYSRIDYNSLSDATDVNGKPLAGPMPAGKQKMIIKAFLNRLANPPRVYDFKDQADLQRRNPQLYARAAAARPEGDFDTASAAGYSFGDGEVIIFTDRIANEKHLKFVVAHETLGHYGLRGVIPAAEFDRLMAGIYDDSSSVQRAVDAAMQANEGLSRAEAVEEYLSDLAAEIDTSVVRRVWNAIKNVMNRLGVSFDDDTVRYVLDQARRYARSPRQGFPMDLNSVAARMHAVETGTSAPGRYKSASDMFKDQRAVDEFARMGVSMPNSFSEGLDAMAGQWGGWNDKWSSFKSTFLSLHGFDSRTNPGSKRLHDILQEAGNISMAVRNTLNEAMRPALNRALPGTSIGGMNTAQYARANELLHHARIRAVMRLRETPLESREPLVVFNEDTGKLETTAEVERLDQLNRLTLEEARSGFSYVFVNTDAEGNVESTQTVSVPADPTLTENSPVWLAYNSARKGYIETELRLLKAQLSAGTIRESTAFKEIGSVVPDGQLNTAERRLIRRAIRRYQELYSEGASTNADGAIVYVDDSIRTAKEFAVAFNKAVIANEEAVVDAEATKRNDAVRKFFAQEIQDDVVAEIEAFKQRTGEGNGFGADRFIVQNKIISLHTQSMQEGGASAFAKSSIATQYSPIVRTGDYETRMMAVDATTGRPVSLDAGFKNGLVYSQFESRAEAQAFQKKLRDVFGATTYTVKARNSDGQIVDTDVRFEPVVDRVLVEAANPLGVNLNEFIAGLNYFDINLRPEKREEIVQALTRQDAAARNRLQAGLNPGDARDAISGIAKHVDGRASTIAKVQTRPLIDELMNLRIRASNELWSGNKADLDRKRARLSQVAADPEANKETQTVASREYAEALMMYEATNPAEGESRKNESLNKAARTLNFLDNNASVNESDFEGSGVISAWRSYTSLIQLGGSIATGILNPVSVYTNGVPYLASYNPKTAFGGGFGAGRALTAVNTAFAQVGVPGIKGEGVLGGMNTAEFWDKVVVSPALQKKYSVTARESEMIAREIREGRMIPAQSNALINSARGRTTRGALSKGIDAWMSPFNLTEQASRRAFGLAAFRLQYAQQMAAIDSTIEPNSAEFRAAEAAAYENAVEFAGKAMDTALGNYSVLNRPAFFRSGLASMLYMYKVFPTTSIQMFMNLSRNGKMGMLAGLWIIGGVAAFPFAEDLEDLLDTLMQKSGIGQGSVRAWAAQRLDEISPGLTPVILKGVMGNVLPGDIASRVALSVIPGTDALLAGSNMSRAVEDIAGPMPSALLGSMQFAADLVRTPFSTTQTLESTLRAAPVTGLRMAADAYAYSQTGSIIDRRGYVVAPNVTGGELAMRLMGFYPSRAAEQYGNIRVMNRVANYRREAATAFRQEWVTARGRNDRERTREIEQAVRDWNTYHKGTPLEITNFLRGSQQAFREAQRPATERALRTTPRAGRDQMERIADALSM